MVELLEMVVSSGGGSARPCGPATNYTSRMAGWLDDRMGAPPCGLPPGHPPAAPPAAQRANDSSAGRPATPLAPGARPTALLAAQM